MDILDVMTPDGNNCSHTQPPITVPEHWHHPLVKHCGRVYRLDNGRGYLVMVCQVGVNVYKAICLNDGNRWCDDEMQVIPSTWKDVTDHYFITRDREI